MFTGLLAFREDKTPAALWLQGFFKLKEYKLATNQVARIWGH